MVLAALPFEPKGAEPGATLKLVRDRLGNTLRRSQATSRDHAHDACLNLLRKAEEPLLLPSPVFGEIGYVPPAG